MDPSTPERREYEQRFQSLFDRGRGFAFPCDALGRVDVQALCDGARTNYVYAGTVVGLEFAIPAVRPRAAR